LGGGEDDTISFTENEQKVRDIERSLHEAWYVTNGQFTLRDMIQVAAKGGGGVGRPWVKEMLNSVGYGWNAEGFPSDFELDRDIDLLPAGVRHVLDVTEGRKQLAPSDMERNASVEDWILDHTWSLWKYYTGTREHLGGFMDPLFFGTNWRGLAKLNPHSFAALRLRPKPGAMGYQMGALGEWRTVGGDTVDVTDIFDYFMHQSREDFEEIVGWVE
jgi:hypothetical protein